MDIEKANKAIRIAYIYGIILGTITLIVGLLSLAGLITNSGTYEFDLWNLLNAPLIFGLAFGIYKKNRVCALIMFVYFIAARPGCIIYVIQECNIITFFLTILFIYAFIQGIRGTLTYHILAKK
jgi:hypothetical protein